MYQTRRRRNRFLSGFLFHDIRNALTREEILFRGVLTKASQLRREGDLTGSTDYLEHAVAVSRVSAIQKLLETQVLEEALAPRPLYPSGAPSSFESILSHALAFALVERAPAKPRIGRGIRLHDLQTHQPVALPTLKGLLPAYSEVDASVSSRDRPITITHCLRPQSPGLMLSPALSQVLSEVLHKNRTSPDAEIAIDQSHHGALDLYFSVMSPLSSAQVLLLNRPLRRMLEKYDLSFPEPESLEHSRFNSRLRIAW